MIKCPKCNQSLPDTNVLCQFCGADTRSVPRAAQPKQVRQRGFQTAPWIWPAYYICSGWYIFSGASIIISTLVGMSSTKNDAIGQAASSVMSIGLIIGVISIIVGIGLILKVEFIRGVTNIFCFINLIGAFLGIVGIILGSGLFGPVAYLYLGRHVFDLATSGLMIYLIGETD